MFVCAGIFIYYFIDYISYLFNTHTHLHSFFKTFYIYYFVHLKKFNQGLDMVVHYWYKSSFKHIKTRKLFCLRSQTHGTLQNPNTFNYYFIFLDSCM